jgi:TM2 domain
MNGKDRVSDRSKLITLVLALTGGVIGLHRIFTGHRSSGLIQMVVSLTSMSGALFLYLVNPQVFDLSYSGVTSLQYALIIIGLIGALLVPVVLIGMWVLLDISQLLMNRFDDVDGDRIEMWFTQSGF